MLFVWHGESINGPSTSNATTRPSPRSPTGGPTGSSSSSPSPASSAASTGRPPSSPRAAAPSPELASRRGYDGPRARELCRLGYALAAEPALGGAAARQPDRLPRRLRHRSHPPGPGPPRARRRVGPLGALRAASPTCGAASAQRVESVRQGRPADRPLSAYVTARTAEKVDRCRQIASQKAGVMLTNGQLLDVLSTGYLLENDVLEREGHGPGRPGHPAPAADRRAPPRPDDPRRGRARARGALGRSVRVRLVRAPRHRDLPPRAAPRRQRSRGRRPRARLPAPPQGVRRGADPVPGLHARPTTSSAAGLPGLPGRGDATRSCSRSRAGGRAPRRASGRSSRRGCSGPSGSGCGGGCWGGRAVGRGVGRARSPRHPRPLVPDAGSPDAGSPDAGGEDAPPNFLLRCHSWMKDGDPPA